MNEFDLAGHLDRAVERNAHIAHGERYGIAIDHHQPALRIDDEAGAVIVLLRNSGDEIRHVERDHYQGRRQAIDARIAGLRELRGRRRHTRRQGSRCDADARPDPQRVVALALARGKPASIHANDFELRCTRVLERHVAHRCPGPVGQIGESRFEIREGFYFLAVERADQGAVRYSGAAEYIAWIRDINTLDRQVVVPRLLVRERMHDRLAEFDVLIGGDGAQGLHIERVLQRGATALSLDLDLPTDVIVEHILQREELGYRLAVDPHQDVAGRQHAVPRGAGLHIVDHQHARQLGISAAHPGFRVRIQAETPQFIIGCVLEYGFQGTARYGLGGFDEFQRPDDCRQRQVKTRRGAGRTPGI